MGSAFETESELDEFSSQFLARTLPKAAWTWENPATALDLLRSAIPRYNEAIVGWNTEDSGYHETLTCDCALQVAEARLSAVSAIGVRRSLCSVLFRDYCSFDVVRSRDARRQWIPPDLLL